MAGRAPTEGSFPSGSGTGGAWEPGPRKSPARRACVSYHAVHRHRRSNSELTRHWPDATSMERSFQLAWRIHAVVGEAQTPVAVREQRTRWKGGHADGWISRLMEHEVLVPGATGVDRMSDLTCILDRRSVSHRLGPASWTMDVAGQSCERANCSRGAVARKGTQSDDAPKERNDGHMWQPR